MRVVALVVVTDVDDRVLLVRSAKRAGRWELPGGQVEDGESPVDAAIREVYEETGLSVSGLSFGGMYYGRRDGLLRLTFVASIRVAEIEEETQGATRFATDRYDAEILEARWFGLSALPHPMPTLARRMISAALSGVPELASVDDDSQLSHEP